MALNHKALFKVATGRFYWSPTAKTMPTNFDHAAMEAAGWIDLGHTSLEDIMPTSAEGGETDSLGTLQDINAYTNISARKLKYTVKLHEWSETSLKLAYGANSTYQDGVITPAEKPVPSTGSWCAVFVDGDKQLVFFAKNVDAIGESAPELTNTNELTVLPITFIPKTADGEVGPVSIKADFGKDGAGTTPAKPKNN